MNTFLYTNTFKNTPSLDEEKQTREVTMTFAKKTDTYYTNIAPFFHCHEFITDILFMEKTKFCFSVYGLNYQPNEEPYNPQETLLILNLPNSEFKALLENLPILHKLEDYYQIKHTQITLLESIDTEKIPYYNYNTNYQTILITADKMWLLQTISLSLYTTLLRCLTYKLIEKPNIWQTLCTGQDPLDNHGARFKFDLTNIKFQNLILYLNKLCTSININDIIPEISINENNKYSIHSTLGFVSFYKNYTYSDNGTKILEQIKKEQGDKLCLEDVKDVIPV